MGQFNPYAPPQQSSQAATSTGPVRGQGDTISFSRETFLPSICVKCAAREPSVMRRRAKQYVFVPWYGRMFGVLGVFLTRKMARVDLPICAPCDALYRRAVLVMWCLFGVGMFWVVVLLTAAGSDVDWLVLVSVLGVVATVIATPILFFAVAFRRLLPQVRKIDDVEVTLARVHPDTTLAMTAVSMNAPPGWAPYGAPNPQVR